MLMGGNRSTGMRTRMVVPTIAMTRQQTTMKYGFRIANRDIRTCPQVDHQRFSEQPNRRDGILIVIRQQPVHSMRVRKQFPLRSILPTPVERHAPQRGLASSLPEQRLANHYGSLPESE